MFFLVVFFVDFNVFCGESLGCSSVFDCFLVFFYGRAKDLKLLKALQSDLTEDVVCRISAILPFGC